MESIPAFTSGSGTTVRQKYINAGQQPSPAPDTDSVSIGQPAENDPSGILTGTAVKKHNGNTAASAVSLNEAAACGTAATSSTASSLVPAPLSVSIADQMKSLSDGNVRFMSQRLLRIPGIMDKYAELSASEAAAVLTEKGEGARQRLFVNVGNRGLVPFTDKEDVEKLAAYRNPSGQPQPVKDLAELLNNAEKLDCTIHMGGQIYEGGFAPFQYLTGSSAHETLSGPATIMFEDVPLFSLTPGSAEGLEDAAKKIADLGLISRKLGNHSDKLIACVLKTPEDVPVPFRIGVAKAMDFRAYDQDGEYCDPDAAGDYMKLLENSKDGGEFKTISRCYSEAKVFLMKSEREDELESAFGFIAGPLKGRPEEFKTVMYLLKSNHPVENAQALLEGLSQPSTPADYQNAAEVMALHKNWDTPTITMAMKEIPGVPLKERVALIDNLARHAGTSRNTKSQSLQQVYDGMMDRFTESGDAPAKIEMVMDILNACKGTQPLETINEITDLTATRFSEKNQEHMILVDLLKEDIDLGKALKAYKIITADDQKDDVYLKTAAFKDIYRGVYKGNNNYVEKAICDFGVASLCREPGETIHASAARLADVNRTLGMAPLFKDKSWKKVANCGRDLLLWTAREQKKGTFGSRTLNDAVALVMAKTLNADSLDKVKEEALKDQGIVNYDHTLLELDDMICIGGVRLNIRAE